MIPIGHASWHWAGELLRAIPCSMREKMTPIRHPDAQSGSSRRFYESIDTAALQRTQPAIQKAHGYLRTKPGFWRELRQLTSEQCVSESRLVYAESLSVYLGGAQIYVRDDVKRPITEASTINAVGQALIARHLGCTRLFAGAAGAGHIEAVAEIAKTLNMEPVLFATEKDQVQQGSRIARISLDGVQVRYIGNARTARTEGQRAALAAALEDPNDCFYVSPVDAGPHPYPVIVQDLLGMTGRELRLQIMSLAGQLPRAIVVNDADSMNAVGYLHAFIDVRQVELTCVQSAAPHRRGRKRLAREHAWLGATGRVRYTSVADEVARYAALNLTPNQAMQKLRLSGGEVMAEAIRLSAADGCLAIAGGGATRRAAAGDIGLSSGDQRQAVRPPSTTRSEPVT